MYAVHPSIAKRWERLTPKGVELPSGGSSEESPNPKINRLPRSPGPKRDFGSLSPNQKARHVIAKPANEKEAMQETPVQAHLPDGRREKMSLTAEHPPLRRRDILTAGRKP
jgi:hypothetical protein